MACEANTLICLCESTQVLHIKFTHCRQNAVAFPPEHISQVASNLPWAFSILEWSAFIRLMKNAVGSLSGLLSGNRVGSRQSGQGNGWLGW